MKPMEWTKRQQQVIEARNCNLLVSAAAGSGKTAVLVERILQMILDPVYPLSVDELLVMTFTNAAAAEMRQRIFQTIEKYLETDPENEHLQKQITLVHHAQITTIDSFCLYLLRNYFNQLELDPSFRIGDEGELLLLQEEVMQNLLEDFYLEGNPAFLAFVDSSATGKTDSSIETYIRQVYRFAQSNPWPKEWLQHCREDAGLKTEEDLLNTPWMRVLMGEVEKQGEELVLLLEEATCICREPDGPAVYEDTLSREAVMLQTLTEQTDYPAWRRCLEYITFERIPAVRSKEVDGDKKARVSAVRDRVKKMISKWKGEYASRSIEDILLEMAHSNSSIQVLLDLTEAFIDRYQLAKKEKNLVDFYDLEHFALQILIVREDGNSHPTRIADELCHQFKEILLDEYQDSNLVQEALIQSLSSERFGSPNLFMVGDVKQSIYKFRLARPELFLEKYESYAENGSCKKIELDQNFRSRTTVIDSINDVFYKIMTKNLGGIQYTDKTALYPGAEYKEPVSADSDKTPVVVGTPTELCLVNIHESVMEELDEEQADYTSKELEARLIVTKIRELMDSKHGLSVWDKKKQDYRPVKYGDIVILLRSLNEWTEVFLNVLNSQEIPAFADSRTGYFSAIEVEVVLAMLAVIDNSLQDIPLAAVLKSPIAGLTDLELAHLMAVYKQCLEKKKCGGLYAAWRFWLNKEAEGETEEDKSLTKKLLDFDQLLQDLRFQASYLPLHQLIYAVYRQTGYYEYAAALPSGHIRQANLDMLVEKAAAFEKTSYKGLFHFIRYIEKLKKYDTDFGEAAAGLEPEDNVRIMSIHKSKGLEFPVVILAGMAKRFNKQDAYQKFLIDADFGIAADEVHVKRRLKSSTLKKNILKRRTELEGMGEELRVFYVAMTRAKEKLIMTAADTKLEKRREQWEQILLIRDQLPYTVLASGNCYLDWVLMSMAEPMNHICLTETAVSQLVMDETERQFTKEITKREFLNFDRDRVYCLEEREWLERMFSYRYPYEADTKLYAKISVSEIKRQGQVIDQEDGVGLSTPSLNGEVGSHRGTAYHSILQHLPIGSIENKNGMMKEIETLKRQGRISAENLELVEEEDIWKLLASPLGKRMARADLAGKLHKEQQFVIGIPAKEMELADSEELILIQGIMDVYFEDEDGLVIVDYKTDRVSNEEVLRKRYREQLLYYRKALEQMTKKKVKECIIYSLTLHKSVLVPYNRSNNIGENH